MFSWLVLMCRSSESEKYILICKYRKISTISRTCR